MSAAGLAVPEGGLARSTPRATGAALLAVVALAALLRLIGLGAEPLWLDEAFTWRWAHLPWDELWGPAARTETNPPLWFAIERLVLVALGPGEAALRLPAALLGVAAVPLGFLLARRLAGERAGLVAALLLAADPLLVAYSQEARGYALLVAGTLLAAWGVLAHLDGAGPAAGRGMDALAAAGPRLLPALAFAAGSAAALWAHNTGLLVPLLGNLAALLLWLGHGADRRLLPPWIAANLLAFLPWLWWLPMLLEQAGGAVNVGWIRQPSPLGALAATARLHGPHALPLAPAPAALLGLPILALAAWAALRLRGRGLVLLLPAAGLPVALYLLGLLVRPVWIERALLPAATAALVLAGIGLAAIGPRKLRAALLALLLLPRAADLAAWHLRPQKLAWPEAAAMVGGELRPGDAILLLPHIYHWPWAYYAAQAGLPAAALGVVVGPPPPPGSPLVEPVDRGLALLPPDGLEVALAGHGRAWLLAYKRRGGDPGGVLGRLARAGRLEPRGRLEGAWDAGELELLLWIREGPDPPAAVAGPDHRD